MLPKHRRRSRNRLAVTWEFDWSIHNGNLSQHLMIGLDDHFPGNCLRLRECILDPQYGRMRNLVLREQIHELVYGLLAGDPGYTLIHSAANVAALHQRIEPGIFDPVVHSQGPANVGPEAVGQAGDDDGPILGGKYAVGNKVRMLGSLGLRICAGEKRQLRQVGEHADHPIEQADINQAPASGYTALVQGRQYGHRAIDPTHQVAQRNPQFRRWAVRFAVDAERPGQGLHDDVEGGAVAQRPGHAEPRDRTIDEPRIDGGQWLISQPQAIHDARAIVFNENVAFGRKILDQRYTGRGFQIDDNAFLAAVDAQKVVTLTGAERRKGTGFVSRSRRLDFDHLGAEIGEGERGCRPSQHASEVENTNSLQRAGPAHDRIMRQRD